MSLYCTLTCFYSSRTSSGRHCYWMKVLLSVIVIKATTVSVEACSSHEISSETVPAWFPEKEKSCRFEDLGSEEVAGQKSWHCWPEIPEKRQISRSIVVVEKLVSSAPLYSLLLYNFLADGYAKYSASLTDVIPNFLTSKTNQMLKFCSLCPLWKQVATFPKFS